MYGLLRKDLKLWMEQFLDGLKETLQKGLRGWGDTNCYYRESTDNKDWAIHKGYSSADCSSYWDHLDLIGDCHNSSFLRIIL